MLHQQTTCGAGTDGGAAGDSTHWIKFDIWTRLQYYQWVHAAFIFTAIWTRNRTFPFLQTLPAEHEGPVFLSRALCALYTQIMRISSGRIRLATRTLMSERQKKMFLNSLVCLSGRFTFLFWIQFVINVIKILTTLNCKYFLALLKSFISNSVISSWVRRANLQTSLYGHSRSQPVWPHTNLLLPFNIKEKIKETYLEIIKMRKLTFGYCLHESTVCCSRRQHRKWA